VIREQFAILHSRLLAIVRDDTVCRRLMTIPGVDPVVALIYRATGRRPRALSELQGSRGGAWTDAGQASIGRKRPNRRNLTLRQRDDADDALRSSPGHADAFSEVALAQSLGDEDRQATRLTSC
jgi:transposase